jgi:fluoride exporter
MILAIALGGAIGAVARHLFAAQVMRLAGDGFPWGILLVNVAGSLAMGVLAELFAQKWGASLEMRAFLTVGILGGFTTFSAFSLDTALLIERGQLLSAGFYVLASVAGSMAALFLGLHLVRKIIA